MLKDFLHITNKCFPKCKANLTKAQRLMVFKGNMLSHRQPNLNLKRPTATSAESRLRCSTSWGISQPPTKKEEQDWNKRGVWRGNTDTTRSEGWETWRPVWEVSYVWKLQSSAAAARPFLSTACSKGTPADSRLWPWRLSWCPRGRPPSRSDRCSRCSWPLWSHRPLRPERSRPARERLRSKPRPCWTPWCPFSSLGGRCGGKNKDRSSFRQTSYYIY